MVNEFSEISAESALSDMIQMSATEIADANAWFDQRNEADYWMDSINEE
jgi:hypothetical protein